MDMLRALPAYCDAVLALYGRPGVGWLHAPRKGKYPLDGLVYMVAGQQKEFLREVYTRPDKALVRTVEYNQEDVLGIQIWGADANDALYEIAASAQADDGYELQRKGGFFIMRVGDIISIDEAAASSAKRGDAFKRRMGMQVTVEYVKATQRTFPEGAGYIEHVTVKPALKDITGDIMVSRE